jgi:hypothetical protein
MDEPQTPQRFFKADIEYGEWYNGPSMVNEFLSEINHHIQSLHVRDRDSVIIGQPFDDVSE